MRAGILRSSKEPLRRVLRLILVHSIAAIVTRWLAGIESPQLYSQTYFGTKRLVEEYVDEGAVESTLRSNDSGEMSSVSQ